MKLTNRTFKNMIGILRDTYTDWGISVNQIAIWRDVLASKVSDEFLPKIVAEWIANESKPPMTPAELIHYLDDQIKDEFDSADTCADIIINSARNAYYATDDFQTFVDDYNESFASLLGTPAQEAYIIDNIRHQSNNPKVLIFVYDELKGEVKDCFTGAAEHGVEFLRNHIKKNWKIKLDDTVKAFLTSGNTDFRRLVGNDCGLLEG